uniref:Protein-tyrosine-phosphatase n=1 Tax=Panagrolaimus sp. PS1159 TaxID=55785 RepID=A0AC35GWS3_9BILA
MSTIDNSFSTKPIEFLGSISQTRSKNQYSHLKLNDNYQITQPKVFKKDKNLHSWKTYPPLNGSQTIFNNGYSKESIWKPDSKTSSDKLLFHVSPCDTSYAVVCVSDRKILDETLDKPSALFIQNSFEFPRQQNDKASKPAISKYKASQKLFNQNERHHVLINPQQQILANLASKNPKDFFKEWNSIITDKQLKELPCVAWTKYKESSINRYSNVPCIDNNLVLLPGVPFFNGNYIKNSDEQKIFIAGQGPTVESTEDFWRVILQEKINVIVMLCLPSEESFDKISGQTISKEKSFIYWPTNTKFHFDGFEVEATNVKEELLNNGKETVVISKLCVIDSKQNQLIRKVFHVQHKSWKDLSIPETTKATMFIMKKFVNPEIEKNRPVFVHCSAGIGRTGSFIAAYYFFDLFKNNKLISIEKAVKSLRKMRGSAIQVPEQLVYAEMIMLELIKDDDFAKENEKMNQLAVIEKNLNKVLTQLKRRAARKAEHD